MRPEIGELEEFYASRQGQLARRLIGHQMRQLWPATPGLRVLGVGYPLPFLTAFEGAERVLAMMPGCEVPVAWPAGAPQRVAQVREDELPLGDRAVDRVVLAHALECTPHPKRLLREIWRVLADDGRLAIIVPNRRGLWCLSERTPFGHGQPFSTTQLARMLRSSLFEPGAERGALYLPPIRSRFLGRLAIPAERVGLGVARGFAGVVIVEAEKRVYLSTRAPTPTLAEAARRYVAVPSGLVPNPAPVPAARAA